MPCISRKPIPAEFVALEKVSKAVHQENNDCSVKAIAIACGVSYSEAHSACRAAGRTNRNGTPISVSARAIESLGFTIRTVTSLEQRAIVNRYPGVHRNLQSITTHHPNRFPQAWADAHPNMIWVTANHMLAVKDGQVIDWSNSKAMRVLLIWEINKA